MTSPRERKPYDIELTHSASGSAVSKSYQLIETEEGVMWQRGLAPDVAPQQRTTAFSYEHRLPSIDLPASFESFIYGAGFEDAPDTGELGFKGYNYTQGVDLSWGKRGYLGPQLQTGGTTTQAPVKFVMSSLGLFAMTTRYIFENVAGTWTQRFDAGAVGRINDLIEFSDELRVYLLVALRGQAYYYSVDGITFIAAESAAAAPAYRVSQDATTAGATSLTVAEPTGTAQNDIVILVVQTATVTTISVAAPASWNDMGAFNGPSGSNRLYWARRGGSAPDYQVNFGGSVAARVSAHSFSGARTTGSPIDATGAVTSNAAGTSHTVAAVTTLGANRLIVGVISSAGDMGLSTPPGGTTERYDGPGANSSNYVFTAAAATAATYGPYTATSTNSVASGSIAFALLPAAGTGAEDVLRWAVRGQSSGSPVLWAVDSRGSIRNNTNPTSPAAWSAADATQMGEVNITIAGMEVIDNTFYLVHDGGITSYDGTTVSTVWHAPTLLLASDQCRPMVGPDNRLYFAYGGTLFRLDATDNTVTKVWPRGPQIGNAELNGTITAQTFDVGHGYFAVKNSASNYYVMKFDPSFTVEIEGNTVWPVHTWYYNGAGAVAALLVCPADSDAFSSTNPTLVIGDGTTADYLILPKPGLRPEDDSACRFDATADRIAYGSFINYRAQSFQKWLTRGDIEADDLDADDTIALQYQTPGGTATTIVTANADGRSTSTISGEVEFTNVRYVALLNNGAATTSPVLQGLVLHASPNPPRDEVIQFGVQISDTIPPHGVIAGARADAATLETHLFDAKNERCTVRGPRGTSHTVKVLDIQPAYARFRGGKLETGFTVTAVSLA